MHRAGLSVPTTLRAGSGAPLSSVLPGTSRGGQRTHPLSRALRLLVVVLLVPACTSETETPGPDTMSPEQMVTYRTGTDALWYITISGAGHEDIDIDARRCIEDPAIAEWWPSPGAVSSDLAIVLPPHATEDDAQRIADCFQEELPENALTLTRPAKKQAGQH